MSDLYWEIIWPYGIHPLDTQTKNICQRVIQDRLQQTANGNILILSSANIGSILEKLPIQTHHIQEEISAKLIRVEPSSGVRFDKHTNIFAINPRGTNGNGSIPTDSASDDELSGFILWQTTFDASFPDHYHIAIYDSLLGTEKTVILEEAKSLLESNDTLRKWSIQHYQRELPILRTVVNKVPLIIFGGDPGTGKTALATSIGARLSLDLHENVHFQHMSLAMRGMGYQGRASTLIARSFERIKAEYARRKEPIVIFFDEAEALVGSRDETGTDSGAQENIAIVNAIINGVDGLRKGIHARVVVIFATNLIRRIDSALMRRCYYHSFERPNKEIRCHLLMASLDGMGFTEQDLTILAMKTEPREVAGKLLLFTHSDLVELIVVRAVNRAIREKRPLLLSDLIECAEKAIPTRSLVI